MKKKINQIESLINQTNQTTNKPSFLINARRKGTLVSNKIYNQFLKIVLQEYESGGNHNGIFYVSMKTLQDSHDRTINQKNIFSAIKILQSTQIEVLEDYNKKDKKSKDWASYQMLGSCKYTVFKGLLEFSMDPIFLNLLMELKEDKELIWTELEDKNIKKFRKKHSLPLYEYFKDYAKIRSYSISFSELKVLLDLEDKYEDPKDFKKILKSTIEEITSLKDLKIEVTYEQMITKVKNKPVLEWYMVVKNNISIQEEKGLFNKKDFREKFALQIMAKKIVLTLPQGIKATINENGYWEEVAGEKRKTIEKELAFEIYDKLYETYLANENKIYQWLNTDKFKFEIGETI